MHDADRPKVDKALTRKLEHPTGALQLKMAAMRRWRQTNVSWNCLFYLWQKAPMMDDITFAADD